jgi:hypothetical protein
MQEPTCLLCGEGRSRWSNTERIGSIGPAGVVATACRHRGPEATREAPAEIAVGINWQLAAPNQLPSNLIGNDEITCGNVYSTLWHVTFHARRRLGHLLLYLGAVVAEGLDWATFHIGSLPISGQ